MIFLLVVIYVAFIGLGLPDTILGASWPLMRLDLSAPISAAGILSIIASLGTIASSLCTPKVLRILGTGKLVAYSIAITAIASLGYGFANSFGILCLWAIPMGIGAGAVDVAMNNFAAKTRGAEFAQRIGSVIKDPNMVKIMSEYNNK